MLRQHRRQQQLPRVHDHHINRTGMERFTSSLDTFQQVLGVIHATAPYIEKYGPVVQKLPTMYRMYRAIKDIDVDVTTEQVDPEPTRDASVEEEEQSAQETKAQFGNYPSPKLYI